MHSIHGDGPMAELDEEEVGASHSTCLKTCGFLTVAIVIVMAVLSVRESLKTHDTPSPAGLTAAPQKGGVDYCVIEGTPFSWFIQLCLLVLVILVLLYKRHKEHPPREIRIWLMDTSKQAVSSGFAHICGMINTVVLANLTNVNQECGWYLAAYTIDTTFGVFCAVSFLGILEKQAAKRHWKSLMHTGIYPNYTVWLKQLLAFTAIVILARLMCTVVLCAGLFLLHYPVVLLCDIFKHHPNVFLVTVMLAGPGVMNALQCWIQDNYLKRKEGESEDTYANESDSGDEVDVEDRAPLIGADTIGTRRSSGSEGSYST